MTVLAVHTLIALGVRQPSYTIDAVVTVGGHVSSGLGHVCSGGPFRLVLTVLPC